MKNTMIIKMAAVLALGWTVACQSNTATNTANQKTGNSSTASSNQNAATTNQTENKTVANNDKPATTTTEEPVKTSNGSLATPTEAYKTAYAARKNKDVQGLKRVMSRDALEFLKLVGEGDKKSIEDMLKELSETPQAATDESRNEKITGDTATLEYPDVEGKWKTIDFIKEGGEWKMTFPKADSPGNSNMPKKK